MTRSRVLHLLHFMKPYWSCVHAHVVRQTCSKNVGFFLSIGIGCAALNYAHIDRSINSVFDTSIRAATKTDTTVSSSRSAQKRPMGFMVDIAEKVGPAVVSIETNSLLNKGTGSGIVISADGLILTNAHVVYGASNVSVELNKQTYKGVVKYVDAITDLALIKIEISNLQVLKLADSEQAKETEFVIAVGYPKSKSCFTFGIISNAKQKVEDSPHFNYIQTDAAVNNGNSGGPLINMDGEVVGIITMADDDSNGISFAIPSNQVKDFLRNFHHEEVMARTNRKQLGITVTVLNDKLVKELKMANKDFPNVSQGFIVRLIQSDSPAEQSGLLLGDIITEINNERVMNSEELYEVIELSSGPIELTVLRRNEIAKLTVQPKMSPVGITC